MTFYGASELAASFCTVRKNTLVIAEEIPEDRYGFRPSTESRSVAETLIHIAHACELQEQVQGIERRTTLEGFDFFAFMGPRIADEKKAHSKAEIIALLGAAGERFATWLGGLSDEFLGERVAMPPGVTPASKSRFEMILGVKEHEMHHRAQLMLVERMVGQVPHLTREFQARFAAASAAMGKSA